MHGDRRCAVSLGHSGSRKEPKMSARSCDQLCPITADHMYTDHQGTDDQCALMISVAPAVPPVSVHQCLMSVLISAVRASAHQCHISATYQCLPVHLNATYQCPSELPFSVTHQCQSVPPINANQCRLAVPVSAAYQCQSVLPISAIYQCHVSVLPFSAHQ
ncbi:unnamed protein product [Staurois parvus]|uniref:Uncharacterized protein n=1 Tax=Staurois parvus TaxID=386267 RepID=A0ABN9C7M2_9NEOB|nr:unnamed protein product [Staurois parvus]